MCLQNTKDAILKHPNAFCLHKTEARVTLVVLTWNDLIDTIGGEETWPLLNSLIIENSDMPPMPASDPTDPPTLSPGILTPTSTTLSALGRTATLSITCVPASASASARVRVADTDGPCSGRLRLATSRSNSQRTISLGAAATSNVAFPIDARTARIVNAGRAVRATLRVYQGTTGRSVTVTLRKLSASARGRLLGQARK